MKKTPTMAERFFSKVLIFRWPIIVLAACAVTLVGIQIANLEKDTTPDAFIDDENAALIYRDQVEEIFGLRDPIVVAVVNDGPKGIFNPHTLRLVRWLTDQISQIANVDPERVVSLATESNVAGTRDGILVEKFFEPDAESFSSEPDTQARADEIEKAIEEFPLYQGSLVSRDGTATIIVAELIDDRLAQKTYEAIRDLEISIPKRNGDRMYVAGEGAISGYLSTYIDNDAARLNPLAAIIITVILAVAFLRLQAVLIPNIIVLSTIALTLGAMALIGSNFYVITNGLIVNLIGISVADSIHLFSRYFQLRKENPGGSRNKVIIAAMVDMLRPITMTTITTAMGFCALGLSSDMPPIRDFGLYGALGVAAAWVLTVTLVPSLIAIWPESRRKHAGAHSVPQARTPNRLSIWLAQTIAAHPVIPVVAAFIICVAAGAAALNMSVEENRIDNFKKTEAIHIADAAINQRMDGTYYLDVVVEAEGEEGILRPHVLGKIERLQHFAGTLPLVGGSTSIVDYIKQLNRAVNENSSLAYVIPEEPALIPQLLLLYSSSGDPTDLEEEVDAERQKALVRINVKTGRYSNTRELIAKLQNYIQQSFNEPGLLATLTGRVNVDYHWIRNIADNHVAGVAGSLVAVLLVSCLLFRSIAAGLLSVLPVSIAVLVIYAIMGAAGIGLGVGTAMFAAIAIGLGVDFSIHSIDRLCRLMPDQHGLASVFQAFFASTGKALLYNFLCVALGFSVLVTSSVPPLIKFGTFVAVSVTSAFIAAVILIPAFMALLKPRFAFANSDAITGDGKLSSMRATLSAWFPAALLIGMALSPASAYAGGVDANDIVRSVAERPDGVQVSRDIRLTLIDRRGHRRIQSTRAYRRYYEQDKRTVIFYTEPANVSGTAFLTYDYYDTRQEDDQWLYLPALRKVRRVSAADRGDYFLGTDFTYDEIKKENKIATEDYNFSFVKIAELDGIQTYLIEGVPKSEEIAREIGYSKVRWHIDPKIKMSRQSEYWDTNGNRLKTVRLNAVEIIDGFWTATNIEATNHKSGHKTILEFLNNDYEAEIPDYYFEQRMLRRGI